MREQIGKFLLNQKLKKVNRTPLFTSLDNAQKIGILFDATENSNFETIKKLVKQFSGQKTEVKALGYTHRNKKNDQYIGNHQIDFISRKDFNWFYQPTDPVIQQFIDTPFDVLLVLTATDYFPINYISQLSKSKFKTGKSGTCNNQFELIMEVDEKCSFQELSDQTMRYIQMIGNRNPILQAI
jgi:hypothetical protein